MVRRNTASLGVQTRLASGAVARRSGSRLRGSGRRGIIPVHGRRQVVARVGRTARKRYGAKMAAGRRRDVFAHDSSRSKEPAADIHWISAAGAFRPTTAASRGSRSIMGCIRNTFPIPMQRSAMRPSNRDAPVAAEHSIHAEALGRDAQRQCRRYVQESATTCRAISDFRSTSMRTSRKRFTSCRSRVTPSIIRPRADCAFTVAERWQRLGSADKRPAATQLLRERAARRDVGGFARSVWRLLRDNWRAGLRIDRRGR